MSSDNNYRYDNTTISRWRQKLNIFIIVHMNNMNAHKKNNNRETFKYIMIDLPEVHVIELWFNIKPVYCC